MREGESPEPARARRRPRGLLVPALAFVSALAVGGVVMVVSDVEVLRAIRRSPGSGLALGWATVRSAYLALFTGALGSPARFAEAFASGEPLRILRAFRPLSETIVSATPLILVGLAVALGFKAGLFNIGAEGQLFVGAVAAAWAGFSVEGLPAAVHLPLALLAGAAGGALWGAVPGLLKARTGAHEVITTIMLNYVAFRLAEFLLSTEVFRRPGRTDPISRPVLASAELPRFVDLLRVNWGIVLALALAGATAWFLRRTTLGLEFRAVGLNPDAARTNGIGVGRVWVLSMLLSGGLAGLGGAGEVLGVARSVTPGFSAGIGFDAIALALLGGGHPAGVVGAALLFGMLRAGATQMQASTAVPVDIIVVIQALVVMFIAAPALVRALYRIRAPRLAEGEAFTKGWAG